MMSSPDTSRVRRGVLRAVGLASLLAALPVRAVESWTAPQKFDPRRDAAADVAAAVRHAAATRRRVIVDVGGEWCTWCHIMDRFFESRPELMALRERHYVWVKVNYSKDNPNTALLSRWPRIAGYPHLFVLDARGELVHSQDTSVLESGQSYSVEAMRNFLTRFAPSGATRA